MYLFHKYENRCSFDVTMMKSILLILRIFKNRYNLNVTQAFLPVILPLLNIAIGVNLTKTCQSNWRDFLRLVN